MARRLVVVMILLAGLVNAAPAWEDRDIGAVSATGSVEVAGDVYTMHASGGDIWGTADEFHYMYVPMTGDGEMTARVISVQNTDGWAKAGLMIRETLSASSAFAMMVITPGNGAAFQWRPATGNGCSGSGTGGIKAPYYVRIVRTAGTITGYHSATGSGWTQQGSASVSMGADVYIGLCLTSHKDGVVCTAQFDSVEGTVATGSWRAVNVSPINGARLVDPAGTALRWEAGPEPPAPVDRYNVYFSNDSGTIGHPSSLLCTVPAGAALECSTGRLAGGVLFYWRVDSIIDGGDTAVGTIWNFVTAVDPIEVCPKGDVDGDCQVTAKDLLLLSQQWLDDPACTNGSDDCANLVGPDKVDAKDFLALADDWHRKVGPVVINEIHYDPDVKTELAEFVELHNVTDEPIDLAGWYFSRGIDFVFGAGVSIPAEGFVVVAQDAGEFRAKFGFAPAGQFIGNLDNDGETICLRDAGGEKIDEVDYQLGFPWPTVGDPVPDVDPPNGTGHSIQLINPAMDNDLGGSWRSMLPTPGGNNASLSANAPPLMRQVGHSPVQPAGGEPVVITVKVTDEDGVSSVILSYQIVEPGNYISLNDAQYTTNWAAVPMYDNGTNGDVEPFDETYTAVLPAGLQVHRRLIRYRITAVDGIGLSITGPYPDDPQPNFAYFVYDGVPAWQGAIRPGVTPVVEYSEDVMRSLPVYHLISKKSDVEQCSWFYQPSHTSPEASVYRWRGTLVYDGEVHDHIRYRLRGGVWRQAMGKNMWKFDFLRGHSLQAQDDYGKKYDTKWDKLNFSACIQQGSFGQRGEQGMFEALSFRLFNMAGSPASKTNWVHFRIIDEAYEDGRFNAAHSPLTSGGTQYDGDFWGLYMTIEQMDGRFLDEHKLPDGNLYKMDQAYPDGCDKNNQGPTAVADKSDVLSFRAAYQSSPSADWWGQNVNLDSYYGHYAIYHAVWHGDITSKNHFFYLNPEPMTNNWGTNYLWWQLVWDLDLTWTCYYSSVKDPFSNSGVLNHNVINIANRNRVREIHELLFNPEQMGRLIDEYAAIINDPAGGLSMVDADRAMWDYHWVVGTGAYPTYLNREASLKAGQGRFYEEAEQRGYARSFEGMVQVMKAFVNERQSHMASISSDPDIPYTPTVTHQGPAGYPVNALVFRTSSFSDPQGSGTFAAMKWRIAEVTDETNPRYNPDDPRKYEIETVWESNDLTVFQAGVQIPGSAVEIGHSYRVRCKMKDTSGRWSHWSSPVKFIVGEPVAAHILDDLRITEVMYNPGDPDVSKGELDVDSDEFEFIELKNIGQEVLDLTYVSFVQGITFNFYGSSVTSLGPGQFVLVVRNKEAFESRYGTGLSGRIAGQYIDYGTKLDNTGETVQLVDTWNGSIAQFTYSDDRGWPLPADGSGHSLVPLASALPGEPGGSLEWGGNWRAGAYIGGSPGVDDPELPRTVVLNEIMAHTDYYDPQHPEYESNDWIELYNTTGGGINLNGWYLSDSKSNLKKWAIPSSANIGGMGRISFDEVAGFHVDPCDEQNGFGLWKVGEEVLLSHLPGTSQDRVVDYVRFKGEENLVSLGRYPDGGLYWLHTPASRDLPNNGGVVDIVVDELMYHPVDANEEYIELYNPTGSRIYLENADGSWRLDGAVDYVFAPGMYINAGDRLIVVGFDPVADWGRLATFIGTYGTGPLTAGVDIVGPWSGVLANEGERLALKRPQAADLPEPLSWVVVDEVIYFYGAPWPESPDGLGDALQRNYADGEHSGNDPANWRADSPTPARSP